MNPIVTALITNPAVADASRRALSELVPVVERSLKGMRAGKWMMVGSPVLLSSCFAAGVMVGWMTAPEKGAETRAKAKAKLSSLAQSATARAQAGKAYLSRRLLRRGVGEATTDDGPATEERPAPAETNGSATAHN